MKYYIVIDTDGTVTHTLRSIAAPVGAIEVTAAQYATAVVGVSYWSNNTVLQNNPSTPHATAALWTGVRTERDALIRATDWTQMTDVPLTSTQKSLWATYRQALRDITTQSDPANITWPTTPGGI